MIYVLLGIAVITFALVGDYVSLSQSQQKEFHPIVSNLVYFYHPSFILSFVVIIGINALDIPRIPHPLKLYFSLVASGVWHILFFTILHYHINASWATSWRTYCSMQKQYLIICYRRLRELLFFSLFVLCYIISEFVLGYFVSIGSEPVELLVNLQTLFYIAILLIIMLPLSQITVGYYFKRKASKIL